MALGLIRSLVKTGVAGVLYPTGADRLIGRVLAGFQRLPLVICYHRVVEDFRASARSAIPSLLTSRHMLEQHLDWVGRRYRFTTLDEIGARFENGESFDEPVAAITFDDGYRDVYENAFPLLNRKGIPAAVFVVSDVVGTSTLQTYDRLYALVLRASEDGRGGQQALMRVLAGPAGVPIGRRLPARLGASPLATARFLLGTLRQAQLEDFLQELEEQIRLDPHSLEGLRPLTWDMVAKMHRAGVTIGSHTKTHALLTAESAPTALDEIVGSRHRLERQLKVPVEHFAYPDGRFDADVLDLVSQAGYRFAYTICGHRSVDRPWLTIPRQVLWERACLNARGRFSPAIMSCHAHEVFDIVSRCRWDHTARAAGERALMHSASCRDGRPASPVGR